MRTRCGHLQGAIQPQSPSPRPAAAPCLLRLALVFSPLSTSAAPPFAFVPNTRTGAASPEGNGTVMESLSLTSLSIVLPWSSLQQVPFCVVASKSRTAEPWSRQTSENDCRVGSSGRGRGQIWMSNDGVDCKHDGAWVDLEQRRSRPQAPPKGVEMVVGRGAPL
ncbi:hypothetical protein NL676_037140 [Syzygium grande]|nr:hypothetical protein NL676_037140 [Syzygium grande]